MKCYQIPAQNLNGCFEPLSSMVPAIIYIIVTSIITMPFYSANTLLIWYDINTNVV